MKVCTQVERQRSEALACPNRGRCPLTFLCGARLDGDKYLLPSFTEVEVGEMVWTDLAARPRVLVVRSGLFVSKAYGNDDVMIPMSLYGQGVVIGIPDVYVPYGASDFYFLTALVPTRLCALDAGFVKDLMARLTIDEAQQLNGCLTLNCNTGMYGQALTLAHRRAREKVVSVLLRLSNQLSRQIGFEGVLPVAQEDIAFLAGVERPTVSRELKKLVREGLIDLGYRHVRLLPPLHEAYGHLIETRLRLYDLRDSDVSW